MSNTYIELIEQMQSYPEAQGETDVVCTVHWRINATDGEFSATAYGSCGITFVAGEPFTAYADLTKDQVWGWVADKINVDEIKLNLDKQIAEQVNPPIVTLPLPFEN